MTLDASIGMKRLFPLDTGAFHDGQLRRFLHPKMKVLEFELEPRSKRIHDIIMYFYGSNKNYVLYKGRSVDVQAFHFEAEAYKRMIDGHVAVESDERRITLEIQGNERVIFDPKNPIAIICPTQLRDDPNFANFAKANSVKLIGYDIDVWNPVQSFGLVSAAAKRFLLKNGFIK